MAIPKTVLCRAPLVLALVFSGFTAYAADSVSDIYVSPVHIAQLKKSPVAKRARQQVDAMAVDVASLLRDPECGRPAVLEAKQRFFVRLSAHLRQSAAIGAKGREAVRALAPVVGDTERTLALAAAVARKYPKSAESAKTLAAALQGLRRDVASVAKGRIPAAASSTWVLLTKFGVPFTSKCAGCAGATVGAVKSLAKAAGWGAATGTATFICPETAGASCAAAGVTTFQTAKNIGFAAVKAVGAVASCAAMVRQWRAQKDEFVAAINAFLSSSRALVADTRKTAQQVGAVRNAFKAFRQAAGKDARRELDAMETHVRRMEGNIKTARGIARNEVRPAVVSLGASVVADVRTGVATLTRCYEKIRKVAAHRIDDARPERRPR